MKTTADKDAKERHTWWPRFDLSLVLLLLLAVSLFLALTFEVWMPHHGSR